MRKMRPVVSLLVLAFLVASLAGVGQGADPEPWIDPNQVYGFDPGPGWPEGWSPPPEPTEVPERAREAYEELRDSAGPDEVRPERLEMRILRPMPEWTKEYPYYWMDWGFQCGTTAFVYMIPYPDTELVFQEFGQMYSVAVGGASGSSCRFAPVVSIDLNEQPTPEELEQRELGDRRNESIRKAKGNLDDCRPDETDGTLQGIYVCFNDGEASERFDVPAYLDTTVSRVRVPIRFVSEMMGAKVSWNAESRQVTIYRPAMGWDVVQPKILPGHTMSELWRPEEYVLASRGIFRWALNYVSTPERTVVLTVGESVAMVDGSPVEIDAPPVIVEGRTMVPLRFIAQSLGAKVYWVGRDPIFRTDAGTLGGTYQVHIYTPFWPYFENPSWFLENRAVRQ